MTIGSQLARYSAALRLLLLCAGNDILHLLTTAFGPFGRQRLRVDLADVEGKSSYAEYDNFQIGSEREKYKLLSLGVYEGNAGQHV